jgi:hypothetical protein
MGRAGAAASVAVVTWAAAIGARGRPEALLGAVACLGLLVGVPVGRALLPRADRLLARWPRPAVVLLLVVCHTVIVAVASRAAIRSDVATAAAVAVAVGGAAVVVGAIFPGPTGAKVRDEDDEFAPPDWWQPRPVPGAGGPEVRRG